MRSVHFHVAILSSLKACKLVNRSKLASLRNFYLLNFRLWKNNVLLVEFSYFFLRFWSFQTPFLTHSSSKCLYDIVSFDPENFLPKNYVKVFVNFNFELVKIYLFGYLQQLLHELISEKLHGLVIGAHWANPRPTRGFGVAGDIGIEVKALKMLTPLAPDRVTHSYLGDLTAQVDL